MELIPADQFKDIAMEIIINRIAELESLRKPFLDIKRDRKLDRWEYPRYRNLSDMIATNKSILYSLKYSDEFLMQ